MKRVKYYYLFLSTFLYTNSIILQAQVPQMINYQGRITENNAPLNITVDLTFTIYEAFTGDTKLWSEIQTNVTVENGIFNILLGSVEPFPDGLFANGEYRYLGIQVGSQELTPRSQITSVAYSIQSERSVTTSQIQGKNISSASPSNEQVLKWDADSSKWKPAIDVSGGTVNTTARLKGDGTTSNPLDIDRQNAVDGQVLKWDGTSWKPGDDNAGSDTGGGTLDEAYDFGGPGAGRTIIADNGAVNIAGPNGLTVTNQVSAGSFSGSGSSITNLNASNLSSGTIANSRLDADLQDLADGALTGSKIGTGINASNITSGTISNSRLAATIDRTKFNASDYITALGGIHVGGASDPGTANLVVDGTTQMTVFKLPTNAANGHVLTSNSSGVGTWQSASGGIGGSGTTNYIPRFATSTTLGNSLLFQNGNNIGIGTTNPLAELDVRGQIRTSVRSDGSAGGLTLAGNSSGNEGGQIDWNGAGSYDDWHQDLFATDMRFFTNSSNSNYLNIYNDGTGTSNLSVEGDIQSGRDIISQDDLFVADDIRVGSNMADGKISIYNSENIPSISLWSSSILDIRGRNGTLNFLFSFFTDRPNAGYFAVYDSTGNNQAGMYINSAGEGYIFADNISANLKNFRIDHPNQPGMEIWYASLEGPEAAAYTRGTAQLVNGYAEVRLPEHFVVVASKEGMTVTVTPLSAQSKGLAVIEKNTNIIKVTELFEGNGTYEFDYFVTAVRKGYEDYQVIRTKQNNISEQSIVVPKMDDESFDFNNK